MVVRSASSKASAFSILERIDVGETCFEVHAFFQGTNLSVSSNGSTWVKRHRTGWAENVSDLSVSSNGSTWVKPRGTSTHSPFWRTFSILERIDVGETILEPVVLHPTLKLSVSSNGSTWVKQRPRLEQRPFLDDFQYPRTDRRG